MLNFEFWLGDTKEGKLINFCQFGGTQMILFFPSLPAILLFRVYKLSVLCILSGPVVVTSEPGGGVCFLCLELEPRGL